MPLEKTVWDVMEANFVTVTPETPLREACAILTDHSQGKQGELGLVVLRASEEYIGILTARDILRFIIFLYKRSKAEGDPDNWLDQIRDHSDADSIITVNDVLVRFDVSVQPNEKLVDVIQIMEDQGLEIIPVSNAGRIIGVVREIDIISEVARMAR
jgi:CBS domain-containing protein